MITLYPKEYIPVYVFIPNIIALHLCYFDVSQIYYKLQLVCQKLVMENIDNVCHIKAFEFNTKCSYILTVDDIEFCVGVN